MVLPSPTMARNARGQMLPDWYFLPCSVIRSRVAPSLAVVAEDVRIKWGATTGFASIEARGARVGSGLLANRASIGDVASAFPQPFKAAPHDESCCLNSFRPPAMSTVAIDAVAGGMRPVRYRSVRFQCPLYRALRCRCKFRVGRTLDDQKTCQARAIALWRIQIQAGKLERCRDRRPTSDCLSPPLSCCNGCTRNPD